ncbi:MAG: histidine kinase [Clostridia bacterium]|nr:histidine kinase [Clostridia bacterium]
MNPALNIGLGLQSISVILSLYTIAYFILKGKPTPLRRSYIWCQILIFIWSAGQILQLTAPSSFLEEIYIKVEYISICFIGYSWLMFSLRYTNNRMALNKKTARLFFLAPMFFYLLVLTNNYHRQFFYLDGQGIRHYAVFFWIHTLVSYSYCIGGTFILVRHSIRQMGYARKQSILMILAVSIPFIANIIYLSGNISAQIDITPVTFAISLMLFSVAAFRYRFMNIVPIAFRKIVDNMKEAAVVVDAFNTIVNYNNSFHDVFLKNGRVRLNNEITELMDQLMPDIEKGADTEKAVFGIYNMNTVNFTGELSFIHPERKSFAVNIQPIYSKKKEILGRVISFNDISEYKKLLDELNEKNEELSAMNEQLKEYAAAVEELTIAKERNRFARDVHDTLGHSMTLLIALMEVSSITCRKDPDKTEEKLAEAVKIAREGLKELRRSISGLSPEKLEANSLLNALNKLVSDFRVSGVNVEFTVEGLDRFIKPSCSDVVYRVCQEAMTNSLRHGKAKNISIILKANPSALRLFIFDDGIGCTEIKKGYGLTGMEQRIKSIQGKIIYGSDGESGFNIRIEIPLGEECV